MKKFKDILKNKYNKYLMAFMLVLLPVTSSFAAEGSTDIDTSVLVSTLTSVAENIKNVITQVAPVAIGVTAVFLVWKFGVKFFKGLLG